MGVWVNVVIHIARHGYSVVEVFNRYYYQVDPHTAKVTQEEQLQRNVRFYFCLDCIASDDKVHMFDPH